MSQCCYLLTCSNHHSELQHSFHIFNPEKLTQFFPKSVHRLRLVYCCDRNSRILRLVEGIASTSNFHLFHKLPARCVYSLHASLIGEAGIEAGMKLHFSCKSSASSSRASCLSFQRWIFGGRGLRAHTTVQECKRGLSSVKAQFLELLGAARRNMNMKINSMTDANVLRQWKPIRRQPM